MPPAQNEKRQRITVKVSETFGTLHLEKIEEERTATNEDAKDNVVEWRKSQVIWSVPISLMALWNIVMFLTGGRFN